MYMVYNDNFLRSKFQSTVNVYWLLDWIVWLLIYRHTHSFHRSTAGVLFVCFFLFWVHSCKKKLLTVNSRTHLAYTRKPRWFYRELFLMADSYVKYALLCVRASVCKYGDFFNVCQIVHHTMFVLWVWSRYILYRFSIWLVDVNP